MYIYKIGKTRLYQTTPRLIDNVILLSYFQNKRSSAGSKTQRYHQSVIFEPGWKPNSGVIQDYKETAKSLESKNIRNKSQFFLTRRQTS